MPFNPVREALSKGEFCYMVELVASRLTREAKLFEAASQLAQVPGVVAGSITSYAGGSLGHDPIRVGTAVRARGLAPNIHLTCVNRDRLGARRALEDLHALGLENVFAITGDYPKVSDSEAKPDFDLDSVQLIEMIRELRESGLPFYISAAVSPFKYTEADCAYQYLKLEKKIAAGADYAITQLGYDSKKFRELKRYLDERGLKTPVFGNVYVLPARAAEKFSKGEPPGCWAAPELVAKIQGESKAADKGLSGRLERAARMVAILRGLGYAGAYIGGDHNADHVRTIIKRSEAIASRWEEFAEEISYSPKGGFFFYDTPAPPPKPLGRLPRVLDTLAAWFPVKHEDSALKRFLTAILRWIDKRPAAAHALEQLELLGKKSTFGCQACGNCVLGEMEYVCPMTCPKNLRNGPCGGTFNGQCEVIPEKACVWVQVYDTARAANRIEGLKQFIPPRNRSLQGTSSFINLFLNRDYRPGHAPPLIQIAPPVTPPAKESETATIVSLHE